MKNRLLLSFSVFTLLFSLYFSVWNSAQQKTAIKTDLEYQIGAILYVQKAAEYRALCYQAFNWAKRMIDEDEKNLKKLPKSERRRPRAVIVDIDETVLDNSPAQAYGVINNKPFNLPDWYAWGEMRKAKAVPGAVDFANYAYSKGIRIFYISNRDEIQKQATIDNLKNVGFPDVSEETVILRQQESSKESRRRMVASKYRVVVLLGDNLNDFAQQFEKKSVEDRFAETDKIRQVWGERFIVLPNPMYGDWENAIYAYQRLTEEQKAQKRLEALELP
ncbi:MAG: 5'-nucleotidase, lipoprotein e(P4) family [Pyrinomonadaceae bacterium]|nr:5'-nucleotidase, lipoprotein e(P4) family [Pyrinomonadaceae bacterium]MCX7640831.1 5'-nucleotidase, lipoprotein e(P4) family [Pyrinomonadaceae bacterium]MDW8303404.1 5'-nucleotidase, lipoprotein e(P4) family [Acidobacteriota bacterium]